MLNIEDVPFGLMNAPLVFQRMLNNILGKLRFNEVLVYLDDMLIPSKTINENISILREVLQIFKSNGFTLNLKKCFFLKINIENIGYKISQSGIQPSSTEIQAVAQFSVPKNVHQVRQYLGLTRYFRKFIQDYAGKSKPLSRLLAKNVTWMWAQEQQKSFDVQTSISDCTCSSTV